jgi:hypothetical protein
MPAFHVISAGVQPSVMMALAKRAVQMGGNAKFFATAVRLAQQSYKLSLSVICVIGTLWSVDAAFLLPPSPRASRGRHLGVSSATIVSFAPL